MDKLKIEQLREEIGQFYKKEFGKDLLFVIVYGSWAFGLNGAKSDVDIVGVCLKYTPRQLENTIRFVEYLHLRHGLELDDEVPYENKVIVSLEFANLSINGNGFEKDGKRITIQPIVKTREFLSSKEMAMRLFFNALTTKNILCAGNYKDYNRLREICLRNYVRIFYSAWGIDASTVKDFVENLIGWRDRRCQFYIGFEDNTQVRYHLTHNFSRIFETLEKEQYVVKDGNKFKRRKISWFEEINQK